MVCVTVTRLPLTMRVVVVVQVDVPPPAQASLLNNTSEAHVWRLQKTILSPSFEHARSGPSGDHASAYAKSAGIKSAVCFVPRDG